MPTPATLGSRAAQARREKAWREQRDIRQKDVAKAIGVSGATISDGEADKKVPGEPILAKWATYLGVTPAYLRYGVVDAHGDPERAPLPTKEEAAAATGARVGTPRRRTLEELGREHRSGAKKTAAKKAAGGGRGGGRAS